VHISEFVIYIQNNILTNSNKICDVRFVILTYGWVKTSLLEQDNVGTGKQFDRVTEIIPPRTYLNLSWDPGEGDSELR